MMEYAMGKVLVCRANGSQELVERPMNEDEVVAEIHAQINELKAQLEATDYQAIKYAEGWISEEEYAPIKAHRQEIRDKINELEAQIAE